MTNQDVIVQKGDVDYVCLSRSLKLTETMAEDVKGEGCICFEFSPK